MSSNDEYQHRAFNLNSQNQMKRNPKTGLTIYEHGYWRFMFKDSNNWGLFIFMCILQLTSTTIGVFFERDITYIWVFSWAIPLAMFYNWYCWRERKRGETS